jgi:hypothetical protein
MDKTLQIKHVPDLAFLLTVDALSTTKEVGTMQWVYIFDLERVMPWLPTKVIRAKARRLIRRGLLDGCPCGCRGDFVLTAVGEQYIYVETQPRKFRTDNGKTGLRR